MWHPVSCESTNCQRSRYFRVATILLALLSLSATVIAGSSPELKVGNGFITTRDGVNIHYLIAGTPHLQWHVKVSGRPMGVAQVAPTAGPTLLFAGMVQPGTKSSVGPAVGATCASCRAGPCRRGSGKSRLIFSRRIIA